MPLDYLISKFLKDPKQASACKKVYSEENPSCQQQIMAQLATLSQDNTEILESSGPDWLLCTLCRAGFDEHETLRIFQMMSRFFVCPEELSGIFDLIISQRPHDEIADRCLFSVAMYPGYLEIHTKRTGAPSTGFYRTTGKKAFEITGFPEVSEHWKDWEEFLGAEFSLAV